MINIIGKGGFAREVAAYHIDKFSHQSIYMAEYEEVEEQLDKSIPTVIAIGDPHVRKMLSEKHKDFNLASLIFGKVYPNVGYDEYFVCSGGVIVCPGTIITTNVKLEQYVIVNINCTVGHDSCIGAFTTLSPGVNISGNVNIGRCCYIGSNAVIREGISICDDVIIGAGAVVVKDITEPGTYVGNPVKKIK